MATGAGASGAGAITKGAAAAPVGSVGATHQFGGMSGIGGQSASSTQIVGSGGVGASGTTPTGSMSKGKAGGMVGQVLGTALQAYGAVTAGRTAMKAYQLQARGAETQIDILKGQAKLERTFLSDAEKQEMSEMDRQQKQFRGRQRVAIAKSGVKTTGSPLMQMEEATKRMEVDQLRRQYQYKFEDLGIRQREKAQRQSLQQDARYSRLLGKGAKRMGRAGAVSAGLSGIGSLLTGGR